ncbi:MAG: pentapeptide repeat-containing protein, partial [Cyanobacteria bacterium Co-bin13]|nr:pentapeptide repeat-containing protein [Cyanobacteria bacterium Co-bin13]
ADLSEAVMMNAHVEYTNLRHADLTGAVLPEGLTLE